MGARKYTEKSFQIRDHRSPGRVCSSHSTIALAKKAVREWQLRVSPDQQSSFYVVRLAYLIEYKIDGKWEGSGEWQPTAKDAAEFAAGNAADFGWSWRVHEAAVFTLPVQTSDDAPKLRFTEKARGGK